MSGAGRTLVLAFGAPLTLAGLLASCDVEGVTPKCPPDGGVCVTPPGDPNAGGDGGGEVDDDGGAE